MPDRMPGPLERAEAIRDRIVRMIFAVGLLSVAIVFLVVSYTERGDRTRLISARPMTPRERGGV